MHAPSARAFSWRKRMFKTYYISMDHGDTFRRLTKDKARFMRQMWDKLTRELYPLGELSVCKKSLEINILEPKDMQEIHTYYLHADTTLDQLWELVKEMWREIEMNC